MVLPREKALCISAAVSAGRQARHPCLHGQGLLTLPPHFSPSVLKVHLGKIQIPFILGLLITPAFQPPNIFSTPSSSCTQWEEGIWDKLLCHSVSSCPLYMRE